MVTLIIPKIINKLYKYKKDYTIQKKMTKIKTKRVKKLEC